METVRGLGGPAAPTGLFFDMQTPAAVTAAVDLFEENQERFSPVECRLNALRFSRERFRLEFVAVVEEALRSQGGHGMAQ